MGLWVKSSKSAGVNQPPDYISPILDGGQFIHRFWVGQPLATGSFWVGLKKFSFFELFFSNVFYKPTNPILRPATLFPCRFAFLVGPTL